MDGELTSRVLEWEERARVALQFAEECKQRAARLILQSSVLMQRYDELEETRVRVHEFKAERQRMKRTA